MVRRENNGNTRSNFILIGVSGSGKTTIGQCLAQKLGLGFLDVDHWIERSYNKTIAQIFKEQGEDSFRQKEQEALEALADINNHVVAAGAGLVTAENIESIRELGTLVWLNCETHVAANRLIREPGGLLSRPLLISTLNGEGSSLPQRLKEQIDSLLNKRRDIYDLADLSFNESYLSAEDSARRLKNIIENRE